MTAIGGVTENFVNVNYVIVPTCSDGNQNGDETGVDCGGSCPVCVTPPSVSAITSSGGCSPNTQGLFGTSLGLLWCPINPNGAVKITFIGSNFGLSGATADSVCTGPLVHSADSPTSIVSCDLKANVASAVVDVVVKKTGGQSQENIVVGYAIAPRLISITASSQCNDDGANGLANCPADGGGVTLTFTGTGFGVADARADNICSSPMIFISRANGVQTLVCGLKARASNDAIADSVDVSITAIGGTSNTLKVAYVSIPSCNDGRQNGDETGRDCGGSCPACVTPPTLTQILASGNQLCVTNSTGVAFCPVNNEARTDQVTLTFVGSNFGTGNASAPTVCAGDGKVSHVSGEENTLLTCTLKNGASGAITEAFVAIPGATSNIVWVSYALAPRLDRIEAQGGCTQSGNGITNCPRTGSGVALTFIGAGFGLAGAKIPSVCTTDPVHAGVNTDRGRRLVCNLKGVAAGSTPMSVEAKVIAIGGETEALTVGYAASVTNSALFTPGSPALRWAPFSGRTDVLGPLGTSAAILAALFVSVQAYGAISARFASKQLAETVV